MVYFGRIVDLLNAGSKASNYGNTPESVAIAGVKYLLKRLASEK